MDRHDITVSEATGPEDNPPGLLLGIGDLIKELFPDVVGSGMDYINGKGAAEVAKAAEIRASAIEKLGRMELDRQRQVQERDAALRSESRQSDQDRMAHEQRMYELKTQRLQSVVESMGKLKDLGVTLSVKQRKEVADLLIGSIQDEDDEG